MTGTILWMDGQPEDFATEGQAYVWDRAAIKASNLVMVDEDSTTSTGARFKEFGVDQTGRIFYFDLDLPASARFSCFHLCFLPLDY